MGLTGCEVLDEYLDTDNKEQIDSKEDDIEVVLEDDKEDDTTDVILEGDVVVVDSSFTGDLKFRETDTVSFIIEVASVYTIYTDAIFSSIGTLYNSDGEQIAYDEDSYDDVDFAIEIYLEPGVYSIVISPTGSAGQGRYHLYLNTGAREAEPEYLDYPVINVNSFVESTLVKETIDYYKVEITLASYYTIYTYSDFDSMGVIYDSKVDLLYSDDQSAGNNDFAMQVYLEPDVYYIGIYGYDELQEGSYKLVIEGGESLMSIYQYPEILIGDSGSGWIEPGYNFTYVYTITKSGFYTFYSYSNFDIFASTTDYYGLTFSDDNSGGGQDFAFEAFLQPGTYKLIISGTTETDAGWYYVAIDKGMLLTLAALDDISIGDTINDTLDPEEYIWYKFTMETAGYIDIYVTSGFDSYGYITDEEGNVILYDDYSNGENDFRFDTYLEAGVYYVIVCGFDEKTDYGPFTIYYR